MGQGKLKAKVNLPKGVKVKKTKGGAVTKRANKPVQPKKKDPTGSKKIKQIITRAVNKSVEEEIRSRAASKANKNLSKAQQAVADHHNKQAAGPSSSS